MPSRKTLAEAAEGFTDACRYLGDTIIDVIREELLPHWRAYLFLFVCLWLVLLAATTGR